MNVAAHRRIWLIAALMALTASANGDSLVFVPQWDNILGATNYSWFSADNWFIPDGSGDLNPAGSLPRANDDAIITSLVDVEATGVRVVNLLLTNNAVVSNGTFSVQSLQMLSASSFQNSSVNILVSLNVGGTNCSLNGTFMEVLSFAYATFAPVAPATASTLTLAKGSVFQDSGKVTLAGQIAARSSGKPFPGFGPNCLIETLFIPKMIADKGDIDPCEIADFPDMCAFKAVSGKQLAGHLEHPPFAFKAIRFWRVGLPC